MEEIRSATVMREMLLDPERLKKLQADPVPVIEEAEKIAKAETPAYIGDRWLYRIAIGLLGFLAIVAIVGSIVLVGINKTIPEVLVAMGSIAVGAIVGLFAPSPTGK